MEPALLPLKSVVLFVACGATVAFLVGFFVKRQLTRFAHKSTKQTFIDTDMPKSLKLEIERRLKRTQEIKHEPDLLSPFVEQMVEKNFQGEKCHFLYRMKAMDSLKKLDVELSRYSPHIRRPAMTNLRLFLLEQRQLGGALHQVDINLLEKFVVAYEHARHHHVLFDQENYEEYMSLLNQLIDFVKRKRVGENRGEVSPATRSSKDSTPTNSTPTNSTPTNGDKDSGIQVTFRSKKSKECGSAEEAKAFMRTSCSSTGKTDESTTDGLGESSL